MNHQTTMRRRAFGRPCARSDGWTELVGVASPMSPKVTEPAAGASVAPEFTGLATFVELDAGGEPIGADTHTLRDWHRGGRGGGTEPAAVLQ